jgi:hypothetical protein
MNKKSKQHIQMAIVASLVLGLAPFTPEPHIWKQIKNIMNGTFTQPIDQFDLLMHGAPWIILLILLIKEGIAFFKKKKEK